MEHLQLGLTGRELEEAESGREIRTPPVLRHGLIDLTAAVPI